MARPTDTVRGALLAREISQNKIAQPDLFLGDEDLPLWHSILAAADDTIDEYYAYRRARDLIEGRESGYGG